MSTKSNDIPDLHESEPDELWQLYTYPSEEPSLVAERPSLVVKTAIGQVSLFRIIHETILTYCAGRGIVRPELLLTVHERFLRWQEELPRDIADLDNNGLPHVLYLQ